MRDAPSMIVLTLVLSVGFLVFLSVLISQVGGVQIRSASQTVGFGVLLSDQETLSPGAPTVFQVRLAGAAAAAEAVLRLPEETVFLAAVPAADVQRGAVSVAVPCSGAFLEAAGQLRGRVVLLAADTGAVLAQSAELAVLPAGPDCFFR